MIDRITAWFPVVLLMIFAAVTLWLSHQVQPPERGRDGKTRHDPDYIVQNLAASRVGPLGLASYTLTASRLVHYADDDTTHLDMPKLIRFDQSGANVTATAKNAQLSPNGKDVYLTDDVRLVRAAYADKTQLTIETQALHVIPDDNYAKTTQPVRIQDAHSLTTSVGLEFNSETHVLKLLSNVRSMYDNIKPQQ